MVARLPLIETLNLPEDCLAIFQRLQAKPYPFLLDSGMNEGGNGRFSFLGADPFLVIRSRKRQVVVRQGKRRQYLTTDPLTFLQRIMSHYHLPAHPYAPAPFLSGAVGYFSYDLSNLLETLPESHDDLLLPELYLGFYDLVVIIDHEAHCLWLSSSGLPWRGEAGERRARQRLKEFKQQLSHLRSTPPWKGQAILSPPRSNFSPGEYREMVKKAKDYIAAGDIFQVNLSQRFTSEIQMSPWNLYCRLRRINPAPFAAFLQFPDVQVGSASPERFLKLSGRSVETRPIKGTRPRGRDPLTDEKLRQELQQSAKDRAELIMIVDLERNDLGRVCQSGSVRVPDLLRLEKFPTVFHLVATVVGELREECDVVDLLRNTFPGGSITGAPKIRAMEIIAELEPVKRGVYTGSVGYLDFTGNMDLNIIIRTFVVKGHRTFFQVGGGIVADSDPQLEYEETLHKGRALFSALKNISGGRTRK